MLCPMQFQFPNGVLWIKVEKQLGNKASLCFRLYLQYWCHWSLFSACIHSDLCLVLFITIQIVLKGLTIITDMKKCTNMYIDYRRRKHEYCRTTSFAGLCITVLPVYSRIIDSLCPSHYRPHAYSQSWMYSNTQQATSAHVSCSEATQISLNMTCFWKMFFLTIFRTNSCHHVLIMSGKSW